MPEHIQYKDDDLFNPETQHEHSDVPVSLLLWFIVIFIVLSFATYFLILFLYKGLASAERKRMDPPETQVARPIDSSVPKNQPLLQPFPHQDANENFVVPNRNTPVTDMAAMRRAQDQTLHTYGWVDPQHTVARIPIEEAKKRFVATYVAPAAPAAAAPPPSSGLRPPSPPKSGGRRVSISELRRTFPTRDEHPSRGGQRPDEGSPLWRTRNSVSYSQARHAVASVDIVRERASVSTAQIPGGTP